MNFIYDIVCLYVCVCAFSLHQESPDMILGDKPLISEVVLSQQPLSEMSHTHRDFFGFVLSPSLRRTQASTDKKCYDCVQKCHITYQYPLALNCLRNLTPAEISKTMLEDESTM
jgi:hypothetical protein